jgi:hypothetical protein
MKGSVLYLFANNHFRDRKHDEAAKHLLKLAFDWKTQICEDFKGRK